jgi:hypothetical protein
MEERKEITHEEVFNDDKKAKLKEFIDKFKGQELFKKSNDRAREILANIEWLPKVCNDCNTALESCTCIEDTLDMKEDEFCYYSGLPSPKAYEEPKQETLEEAAEKYLLSSVERNQYGDELSFIDGAKWQQERMYSEEDMIAFGEFIFKHTLLTHSKGVKNLFEQFKKK